MFHKVMIVEDEDMIRKGLKYGFDWQKMNCHVVADSNDANEAIRLMAAFEPDIVLMDINLPVMSGLEIIAKTKKLFDYTPIIISGYSDFNYAQQAIDLGVVSYITKPVDNKKLEGAVRLAIKNTTRKTNYN